MESMGTKEIRTKRLILRPPMSEDAETLVASGSLTMSIKDAETALKSMAAEALKPYTFHWVIELDGKAIGRVKGWEVSQHNDYVQLGYDVTPAMRGQGIMTEAVRAVLKYLLTEVNANRVFCSVRTGNTASRRVCEKSGMHLEGVLRQHYARPHDGYDDVAIYGMIRQDLEEE